jgi:uncharacterized protein DUF1587
VRTRHLVSATLLPPDDSAQGFDNIADVLGLSPSLLEGYLTAAGRISALAVGDPSIGPTSQTFHVRGDASQTEHVEGLGLGTRGGLLGEPTLPLDGEYVINVKQTNLGSVRGLESPSRGRSHARVQRSCRSLIRDNGRCGWCRRASRALSRRNGADVGGGRKPSRRDQTSRRTWSGRQRAGKRSPVPEHQGRRGDDGDHGAAARRTDVADLE